MRLKVLGYLGLVALVVLCFQALKAQKPLAFFVLRDLETPEAFRVELTLGSGGNHVEPLGLTGDQRRTAADILKDRDIEKLERFAKDLGIFHAVIGLPWTEGAWPSFWGSAPSTETVGNEFDDLTWADRVFFSSVAHPLPSSSGPASVAVKVVTPTSKNEPTPNATAVASALLLVEIQNGCGITGAADWVSRRLQGAPVSITGTGNANNFHHLKTVVRTDLAPAAVVGILDRLCLDASRVDLLAETAPANVHVVVVVGRDIRKLKEKWRERDRNGTQ